MKKALYALIFLFSLSFVSLGASTLLRVNLTSDGHMTATDDALQIDGGSSATSDTSVTFETIDPDQARYAPEGTWSDTFTFESKKDAAVSYELTMYLDGEEWETDKFDVVFRVENSTKETGFELYAEKKTDVEVIVYLHEDLSFDEMGRDVGFEIEFYI